MDRDAIRRDNTRALAECAAIATATILAVVIAQNHLVAAAVIFLAGGIAAAMAARRASAWLVPLAAGVAAALIDLGADSPAPSVFSEDAVFALWLLAAAPGMVAAGVLGAVLKRETTKKAPG